MVTGKTVALCTALLMLGVALSGCGGENGDAFSKPAGQENGKGWIYGIVTEHKNGGALEGASLSIDETDHSTVADNSGMYTMRNLDPGWYTLRAMTDGYKDETSYVQVRADEGTCVNITQTAFEVYTHPYAKQGDLPTVIVFSPHPDDGQIFAGGSECDHVAKGNRVVEIFTATGVTGSDSPEEVERESRMREAEAIHATAVIGVDELVFMRFTNGVVKYEATTLFDAIRYMVNRYHPYLIYTSEFANADYTHPDHIATGVTVFNVAESLNWTEMPTVRFFDYIPDLNNDNDYVDITDYIPTRDQALLQYKSQMDSVILPLTILKLSYKENGIRAGKPGRLCEGFRKARFTPGLCKIYDFNGIVRPSSKHVAWFKAEEQAPDQSPPSSGPEVKNQKEFTDDMYRAISKLDDIDAETRAWVLKRVHNFKFVIDEKPDKISELHVRWKGYGYPAVPQAYIWNFRRAAWELVGAIHNDFDFLNPFDQDQEDFIEKTYVGDFSDYINETGYLYLSVINSTHGCNGMPCDGNRIDTDYVRVRVTVKE